MKNSLLSLLIVGLFLVSCKKDKYIVVPVVITPVVTTPTITTDMKTAVVQNHAAIVYASYLDSYNAAQDLKQKTTNFFTAPSQAGFDAIKLAWLNSRIPYEQTEAYRFYGGPIDDATGPEPLLNSWPMDEGFIDYVQGIANSGVINDTATYPTIDKALLESLNTLGGETNISCGYHAIEFLLWGQDFNDVGPGSRPYTDYIVGGTAIHQLRRKQYLLAAIDLLISDLEILVDAWKPGVSNNYRASFVTSIDSSLSHIFIGMGSFAKGELAGERMTVALGTHSQEDEHSCFSDNTHNDIILGEKSIYNVYIGRYEKSDGTIIDGMGIDDLVKVLNADINTTMIGKLDAATSAAGAIQPPFDQEIQGSNAAGNQRVLTAINAIKAEADELVEVAAALGITIVL